MKVVIEDLPGLAGEYELDVTALTNRDLHEIKQVAGVRPKEIADAIANWDNDVVVAFALCALRRAGRDVSVDVLWDAPVGSITLDFTDEEEDASPPGQTPPDGGESSSASSASSGLSTSDVSAPVESGPSPTGLPSSAMSVT